MNFKNYILIFFGIFFLSEFSFAQNKEIEAQKVAYITTKLNLTPKEAEQFWPLYNEYMQKRENLKMELKKIRQALKENFDGMSDKDIETYIDTELDYKQKELDLTKEFHKKMKLVLPMKKVALYYKAVEEFNKMLLEKIKPQGK